MGVGSDDKYLQIFYFSKILAFCKNKRYSIKDISTFVRYQKEERKKKYVHALYTQRLCGTETITCKISKEKSVNQRHPTVSQQKEI